MAARRTFASIIVAVLICAAATAIAASSSTARARGATQVESTAYMSDKYAKRKLRRFINREYAVDRGPYIYDCIHLSSQWVRCDVEFKAGLYWRCGRGWVRWKGGYVYTRLRAPIGC